MTGLAAGSLVLPHLAFGKDKPANKPNILVIMSDEHNAGVLGCNGDSMIQWLDDAGTEWKDLAVSEYYAHNIASDYAMIRMGRYKYVYHTPADAGHPAERELYDLQSDPGEFNNLAGGEKYKSSIDALYAALIKEIGEHPDLTEQRCRAECAKGYARREKKNK